MFEYRLSLEVQEPWLEFISDGTKIIEARIGIFKDYEWYLQKYVLFYSDKREVWVTVTDIFHYKTLNSYLDAEGWADVAPNASSKDEAIDLYESIKNSSGKQIYSDTNIRENGGIVALVVKKESSSLKNSRGY
jgi:ASC-1-like (ASCH) protein